MAGDGQDLWDLVKPDAGATDLWDLVKPANGREQMEAAGAIPRQTHHFERLGSPDTGAVGDLASYEANSFASLGNRAANFPIKLFNKGMQLGDIGLQFLTGGGGRTPFSDLQIPEIPPNERPHAPIADTLGEGLGFIGTAAAAAPLVGLPGAAAMGAVTNGVDMHQKVLQETGDPDKAMVALLGGAGVGAASAIPVGRVLSHLNQESGGVLVRALGDLGTGFGVGAAQAALNDVIEQHATEKDLPVLQDAAEGGKLGALTVFFAGGLAASHGKAAPERMVGQEVAGHPPESPDTTAGKPHAATAEPTPGEQTALPVVERGGVAEAVPSKGSGVEGTALEVAPEGSKAGAEGRDSLGSGEPAPNLSEEPKSSPQTSEPAPVEVTPSAAKVGVEPLPLKAQPERAAPENEPGNGAASSGVSGAAPEERAGAAPIARLPLRAVEKPVEEPAPEPKAKLPVSPKPGDVSIKNAKMASDLAELGFDAPTKRETISREQSIKRAMEQPESAGRTLVDELVAHPRSIEAEEGALLLRERNRLRLELDEARRVNSTERIEKAKEDLQRLAVAARGAGEKQGRGLNFRQAFMAEDYSFAGIESRLTAAKGAPLDEATEIPEVERLAKEHADATKAEATAREAADREHRISILEKKVSELEAELSKPDRARIHRTKAAKARANIDAMFRELATTAHTIGPQQIVTLTKLAAEHIKLGYHTFEAWRAEVRARIGDKADEHLEAAWAAAQKEHLAEVASRMKARIAEGSKLSDLGRYVDILARRAVESGARGHEAVTDAVHEALKQVDPKITREETQDAISGYGRFRPLPKDPVSVELRDVRGQLQQIGKLRDLEAKQPPKKTGPERREPTSAEKRLQRQVRETMKKLGIQVTDPATQLKSILQSRETYTQNRIQELRHEIDTLELAPESDAPQPTSAKLEALKAELKAVRAEHEAIFGKKGATDEQKAAAALERTQESLAEYERRLREHDLSRPPEKQGPPTAETARLQRERAVLAAKRDAARAEVQALRDLAENGPKRTPEQRAIDAYLARKNRELGRLQERLLYEDFAPRDKKKPRALTPAEIEAKAAVNKVAEQVALRERQYERARWSPTQRALDNAKQGIGVVADVMTSMDLPPLLRQGGVFTLTHPVLSVKAFGKSLPAIFSRENLKGVREGNWREFMSDAGAKRIQAAVEAHPDYQRLKDAGVSFTGYGDTLSPQEENIRSLVSQNIPGVAHTQRGFPAFMNLQRVLVGSELLARAQGGDPVENAKSVARYVNDATGRGTFANRKLDQGLELARLGLFAPRLYLSRLNLLSGAAFRHATPEVRRIIAKDMGTMAATIATLAAFSYMLGNKDVWDWRSSDALKLRVGDSSIDLTPQLGQYYTLVGKTLTGETKSTVTGEVTDVESPWDPVTNFAENKITPPVSLAMELKLAFQGKKGRDKEVHSIPGVFANTLTPLSPRDMIQAMEAHGVPKGLAISLAGLLGAGLNTYAREPAPKHRLPYRITAR